MRQKEDLDEQLHLSKINFATSYFKTYRNTMIAFFLLVVVKRYLTKPNFSFQEFLMLVSHLAAFVGISLIHSYNPLGARAAPFLYSLLSYPVHTKLIFSDRFDDPADEFKVHMTKDMLFNNCIIFAALSINLIYIAIFLTINRRDSLIINSITWLLFIKDTFECPGIQST